MKAVMEKRLQVFTSFAQLLKRSSVATEAVLARGIFADESSGLHILAEALGFGALGPEFSFRVSVVAGHSPETSLWSFLHVILNWSKV